MTEVFKIISHINGLCVSAYVPRSEWRAVYAKDTVTTPTIPGSKLFAYAHYSHATLYRATGCSIWRCEATGVVKPTFYSMPELSRPSLDEVISWWETGKPLRTHWTLSVPCGTVLCNSITLLEEIVGPHGTYDPAVIRRMASKS